MANKRIKDLSTTAAVTASDDFIAVDGATNGTRKLDAYSPTFGGNLTVSGTGGITSTAPSPLLRGSTSVLGGVPKLTLEHTAIAAWNLYLSGTDGGDFKIDQDSTNKFRMALGTGNITLAGNLTVSGGTIGTAASTNLTLNGGSSGASLVLGQGTNGNLTLTPSGGGFPVFKAGSTGITSGLFTQNGYVSGSSGSALAVAFGAVSGNTYSYLQALSVGGNGTQSLVANPSGGNFIIGTTIDGGQKLQVSGTASITGAIAIGNTVAAAASVASTHKVTISIGGVTYYLLASNV